MDLEKEKLEIIESLLRVDEEKVLYQIKSYLNQSSSILTEEDYKELDKRRARHENGESKSYKFSEVKQLLKS